MQLDCIWFDHVHTEEHLHLLFAQLYCTKTSGLQNQCLLPWCTYLHLHGEVYLGALQINDISDIPLPPPSSTEPIRMTVCKWLVPAVRVRTYPLSARSSHEDGVSLFFLEADVMFCPGEETARARAALQEHLTVFLSRVCATNPWLRSESVKFMFSPLHYKGSAKVTSEAADIPQNFALYRCHLLMCELCKNIS